MSAASRLPVGLGDRKLRAQHELFYVEHADAHDESVAAAATAAAALSAAMKAEGAAMWRSGDEGAAISPDARTMLFRVLHSHFLFKDTSKENLETIVNAMGRFSVSPGCEIIREGDPGDNLYVLESGELTVTQKDTPGHVDVLKGNRVFGELALIYDCPRAATVTASDTGAITWYLSKQQFRHLSTQFMNENIQKRILKLRAIPVFANLTDIQLRRVSAVMQEERFRPGQLICAQGERLVAGVNDKFYTIVQGSVQVNVDATPSINGLGSGRRASGSSNGSEIPGGGNGGDSPRPAKRMKSSGNLLALRRTSIQNAQAEAASASASTPSSSSSQNNSTKDGAAAASSPSLSLAHTSSQQKLLASKSTVKVSTPRRGSTGSPLQTSSSDQGLEIPPPGNNLVSLDVLHEGDWFGEVALLRNEPRSANVYALGCIPKMNGNTNEDSSESSTRAENNDAPVDNDTVCYTLSRGAFEQILQTSAAAQETIEKKTEVRQAENNELILRHQRDEEAATITLASLRKVAVIGEGGFSIVRMVIHEPTGDAYALKVMNKMDLLMRNQTEHVNNERTILKAVSHSFILSLIKTFQDDHKVYMLLELVQGGELFSRVIASKGGLPLNHVLFYSSNILEGLSYLHRKRVAYRDLKLENLVIGSDGYLKIIDFGFAKQIPDGTLTRTLCGTPDYLAPECVTRQGHDHSVDCWGLGVIIYEMFTQCSPFADGTGSNNQMIVFQNIMHGILHVDWLELQRAFRPFQHAGVAAYISTRDMLARLWDLNPVTRITCELLKTHPFFGGIPWADLREKRIQPPWVPELASDTDLRYFDLDAFKGSRERDVPFTGDPSLFADFGND